MSVYKYEIGDTVVYEGIIGCIERRSTYAISGKPCYGLVSVADPELSCTAAEADCSPYNGEDVDEKPALNAAHASGIAIQSTVDRLTDKYYRDGNH